MSFKTILLVPLTLFVNILSHAQHTNKILEKYDLVWQDEFDGTEIDTSKWVYRGAGSKRGIGIVQKENCSLDGEGHLIIKATKRDTNYYIGQIATMKHALFKYGYFECRMKVNEQVGPSSAFWLQSPVYGKYIGDPARAGVEIDVMEYRRKVRTDEVHHTIHWDGYGKDHKQEGKSPIYKGVDEGFHTFAVEWTPKKYTFYVDGKKGWSTKKSISHVVGTHLILHFQMKQYTTT